MAYVVAGEGVVSAAALRVSLRERLPEYMVPSAVVLLDGLPLTPNGKVDRKALPAPDRQRPESGQAFVAPRTQTEEVLAGVFAEVLGAERVGVEDNFFELGGHSLLATQVISRVRNLFRVELPLSNIFEYPSVSGLAGRVEKASRGGQDAAPSFIERAPRDAHPPLSFAQQRLWFIDQLDPNNSTYNLPSAVRLTGPLNVEALERSFDEIIRRHESLRTSFEVVGAQPAQIIAPESSLRIPVVSLEAYAEDARGAEVGRLAAVEAETGFDLRRDALLRLKLLRLREDEHVLLFTTHHIISDGWSVGVLVREVAELYDAFAEGRPASLPELPVQYADYAVWQRRWLTGDALDRQLSYWKEHLAGAPPMLELPTDRPRPKVQSFRGATVAVELSRELTEDLNALSRREGCTLYMTLLAAFQTLLHRYTGEDDILVGSPVAGRG
ncbi:MAG: condensation domain-containing protein, partial [Acidobacteria bacterium]|nr:condensation domain-containing protein [Acidobacteriota bacterium]